MGDDFKKPHSEVDSQSGAVEILSKTFLQDNEAVQAVNLPRLLPLPTVTTIRKTLLVVWQVCVCADYKNTHRAVSRLCQGASAP